MLNGAVNNDNCHIWGSALRCMSVFFTQITLPHWVFTDNFILDTFFFEQNVSRGLQKCSMMGSHHCTLLQEYLIHVFRQRQCLETTVLMQDAVPHHIALQVIALLRAHFGDEHFFF